MQINDLRTCQGLAAGQELAFCTPVQARCRRFSLGRPKLFKRGMDAHNNPGFYRQLGKDPDLLLSAALELLARKFSL